MNPFWNLVWIIPTIVVLSVLIAAYLPWGKGPEGPPYVSFSERLDECIAKEGRSEESWGGLPDQQPPYAGVDYAWNDKDIASFPLEPNSTYELESRIEYPKYFVVEGPGSLSRIVSDDPAHLGRPCGPKCWRKPDGHRWETS